MRPVPILYLIGAPREQGRQHGESLRSQISQVREQWRASLTSRFGVPPDNFIETFLAETNFVPAIRRWAPSQLEEIEGIAEGSGRSRDETLAFQFMDEEWWFGTKRYLRPAARPDHCSAIAIRAHDGYPPIVAQNMDLRAYLDGGQAIISVEHPGARATVLTICGMVGLCGINEYGVGVVVNTLWQLPSAADGLPVACVMREILAKRSLADACTWIREPRHASGQHYLIGDPEGFASFEASGTAVNEVSWEGSSPAFVHTNHPLTGAQPSRMNSAEENSRGRYSTLCEIAADQPLTIDQVKLALADRSGSHPISVRPIENESASAMTFASIVMELQRPPTVQLAGGPPCSNSYCSIDS